MRFLAQYSAEMEEHAWREVSRRAAIASCSAPKKNTSKMLNSDANPDYIIAGRAGLWSVFGLFCVEYTLRILGCICGSILGMACQRAQLICRPYSAIQVCTSKFCIRWHFNSSLLEALMSHFLQSPAHSAARFLQFVLSEILEIEFIQIKTAILISLGRASFGDLSGDWLLHDGNRKPLFLGNSNSTFWANSYQHASGIASPLIRI